MSQSARRMHDDAQNLPAGFVIEGSAPIRAPDELIKGVTARDGVTFIAGQSGAGKTYVSIDIAVALTSHDANFFGRTVRERVGVVILAAEGAGTLANRIEVAKRHRAVTDPLPLVWTGDVPNLADSRNRQAVIAKLKAVSAHLWQEYGVRLGAIIIDTVSAAFGMKDENDNAEAARIVAGLREIGAAVGALVLPVHHYGKSADSGLRGGSAFRANTDGVVSVNATRNETTGEVTARSLAVAKYRNGEEGPIGAFDLKFTRLGFDDDGEEFGNCHVEPTGVSAVATKASRMTDRQKRGLATLNEVTADQGERLPAVWGMPDDLFGVTVELWRKEVLSRRVIDPDGSNPRTDFQRLLNSLSVRGDIGTKDDLVWPVRLTRPVAL